jgi:hypothetical protein
MKRRTDKGVGSSVSLAVNGRRWTSVVDFRKSGSNDKHYVVATGRDGKSLVKFGDGVRGSRPPLGSKVTATYRYGAGTEGDRRRPKSYICFSCD